jgi:hypothetical protein
MDFLYKFESFFFKTNFKFINIHIFIIYQKKKMPHDFPKLDSQSSREARFALEAGEPSEEVQEVGKAIQAEQQQTEGSRCALTTSRGVLVRYGLLRYFLICLPFFGLVALALAMELRVFDDAGAVRADAASGV